MIRLPEGKMKSREGTVVDADDLMDEMHRLAREETLARAEEGKAHTEDLSEAELEHRAERIAMAAIKYYLLKFTPRKSFEYDPKESIDFLGQTGPYCLFNYARTRSLLRRAGAEPAFDAAAAARLGTDRELELIRRLGELPETVARAVGGARPLARSPSTSSSSARASPSSSPTRPTTPSPPARTRSCDAAG